MQYSNLSYAHAIPCGSFMFNCVYDMDHLIMYILSICYFKMQRNMFLLGSNFHWTVQIIFLTTLFMQLQMM